MQTVLTRILTLGAALSALPAARAATGPCGAESCWKYAQTAAGTAETPTDVQQVLQAHQSSPAVQETLARIGTYVAAGITPAVTVQASHWQVGTFRWSGPSACSAGDPRLTTPATFSHSYCLSSSVCIPGEPVPPPEKDPCA